MKISGILNKTDCMIHRKQLLMTAFVLMVLSFIPALYAQSAVVPEKVKITQMLGKVEIRNPKTGKWRPARVGQYVRSGWDIRTYVESNVELEFQTGTVVKSGENSILTVSKALIHRQMNATKTNVKVSTGQVWANVKKLSNRKSQFDFETPTAVASIRGTRLGINVGKGKTSVDVYEGKVMVKARGAAKAFAVTTKMRAVISKGSRDVALKQFKDEAGQDAPVDPFVADSLAGDSLTVDSTAQDSIRVDSLAADTTVADSIAADSATLADSVATDSATADSAAIDTAAGYADSSDATIDSLAVDTSDTDSIPDQGFGADSLPAQDSTAVAQLDTAASGSAADTTQTGRLSDDTVSQYAANEYDTASQDHDSPAQSATAHTDTTEDDAGGSAATLTLSIFGPAPNVVTNEPTIVVKGAAITGATVAVDGKDVPVGADGTFTGMADLQIGLNMIEISASYESQSKSTEHPVEYRPPLSLTVANIADNMHVSTEEIAVDVEVTEGADYSINGAAGATHVTLSPGVNLIEVKAWDAWDNTTQKTFTVTYAKTAALLLTVVSPTDGITIHEPVIPVSGNVTPGAKVTVNGVTVPVASGGNFNYRIPIPDEEQEYTVEIIAELGDQEQNESRSIAYEPPRLPITLSVSSPSDGATISQKSIRVVARTSPGATATINGKPAMISPSGIITGEIAVSEHDIGDFAIDISADDGFEEVSKSLSVTISGSSPQINTSAPSLVVQGIGRQATRNADIAVQVLDRTPDDQITLTIDNNGSSESYSLDPGGRERFALDEGQNSYRIYAKDNAGNQSNVISGSMYYLPGPLIIDINEPGDNPYEIDDLPPMPRDPRTLSRLVPRLDVEIEIDDGINNVPATIKYCRLIGPGANLQLVDNKDYTFKGTITLARGASVYKIVVEDIAGNKVIEDFQVIVGE
ncbi:MAG: hypothetical protein GF398_09670 [Chitinivibrionales bacterium]|nr:hypothetical protein [Chitinivibrionales bacterium]